MSLSLWAQVDRYFNQHILHDDPILDATLKESETGGLPNIAVAPNQGMLLTLLAQIQGARKILEIGTLGGYSAICLARALPKDGKLITLEYSPEYAKVARKNIDHAGLASQIEVRVGEAIHTLPELVSEAPFDLVFIDADKPNNLPYFEWAIKLSRIGTLIIMDNVVRDGKVINGNSDDANVKGVREFTEAVGREKRVSATALQTVGEKGYDGLMLIRVNE